MVGELLAFDRVFNPSLLPNNTSATTAAATADPDGSVKSFGRLLSFDNVFDSFPLPTTTATAASSATDATGSFESVGGLQAPELLFVMSLLTNAANAAAELNDSVELMGRLLAAADIVFLLSLLTTAETAVCATDPEGTFELVCWFLLATDNLFTS